MTHSRLRQTAMLIVLCGSVTFAQQNTKPAHSWAVFMNTSGAQESATKLLGHCGDARTQDVMNACSALEFKNADQQMNSSYRAVLSGLGEEDRSRVRAAQRAWLQYRDLHCQTVGELQVGGGSLEPMVIYGCKTDLTKARTKEIEEAYRYPE